MITQIDETADSSSIDACETKTILERKEGDS
jgi:hypothetical protein